MCSCSCSCSSTRCNMMGRSAAAADVALVVVAICKSKTARYNIHPGSPKTKKLNTQSSEMRLRRRSHRLLFFYIFLPCPLTLPRSASSGSRRGNLSSARQQAGRQAASVGAVWKLRLRCGRQSALSSVAQSQSASRRRRRRSGNVSNSQVQFQSRSRIRIRIKRAAREMFSEC